MLKKDEDYILAMLITGAVVIAKLNKDKDLERPFVLLIIPNESQKNKINIALQEYLPAMFNLKVIKHSAIISETNEIPEDILSTYQQHTSGIAVPTSREMEKILNFSVSKNIKNTIH
ncbi:MAG: hypothetical protein PHP92_04030 [Candidatus Nanoarchaeia archaeon]|nr:hypothetical protein [Candidatus Nanoarchaeia archaeon]